MESKIEENKADSKIEKNKTPIYRLLYCESHELHKYGFSDEKKKEHFINFENVEFGAERVSEDNYQLLMLAINGVSLKYDKSEKNNN